MRGDHTNYGKSADCLKLTLRLYGATRRKVERLAERDNVSPTDIVVRILNERLAERKTP